jgi:hypothetical protein
VRGKVSVWRNMPAQFAVTNRRNPGLTSVDRKTSLLSHVQYPVSIKVVYKGFIALSARKANEVVLARRLSLRVNTEGGYIVAFQHGF